MPKYSAEKIKEMTSWFDAKSKKPVLRFDPREAVARAVGDRKRVASGIFADLPLTPFCPNCGAPECHPTLESKVLVRGCKADNASHCLVCASAVGPGGYDENLVWLSPLTDSQRKAGWFDDES